MPEQAEVFVNVAADNPHKVTAQAKLKRDFSRKRQSAWSVKPDGENLDKSKKASCGQAIDGNVENERQTFENMVTLPGIGGNKYTVTVAKKGKLGISDSTVKELELTAWRKIYLAALAMPAVGVDVNAVVTELNTLFQAAFIRFELDTPAAGDPTTIPDADFTFGLDVKFPKIKPGKPTLRLGFVKRAIEDKDTSVSAEDRTATKPEDLVFQGGKWWYRGSLGYGPDDPKPYLVGGLEGTVKDHQILVQKSTARGKVEKNGTQVFDTGWRPEIEVVRENDYTYRLTFTAPGWHAALNDSPTKIDLKFKERSIKQLAGHTVEPKGVIVISCGSIGERCGNTSAGTLARVVAHEVMHAMGGVLKTLAGFTHGMFYSPAEGGGRATGDMGHCHWNLPTKTPNTREAAGRFYDVDKKAPKDIYVPGDRDHCTMFHQLNPNRAGTMTFCAECAKLLRLVELPAEKWS